jgi:hypothetical protein
MGHQRAESDSELNDSIVRVHLVSRHGGLKLPRSLIRRWEVEPEDSFKIADFEDVIALQPNTYKYSLPNPSDISYDAPLTTQSMVTLPIPIRRRWELRDPLTYELDIINMDSEALVIPDDNFKNRLIKELPQDVFNDAVKDLYERNRVSLSTQAARLLIREAFPEIYGQPK